MERELKIIAYLLAKIISLQVARPVETILEQAEEAIPKSKGKAKECFVPPTVEEVAAYCKERGNGIDPVRFVSHYASVGWKVGKVKMSNWRQAIITWEKRENEKAGTNTRQLGKGGYYGEATL